MYINKKDNNTCTNEKKKVSCNYIQVLVSTYYQITIRLHFRYKYKDKGELIT